MYFPKNFIKATEEYCTYEKNIPAPFFRRKFNIVKTEGVTLTVCGLGFYRLFINGKEITAGKLCTSIYNPDHYLFYDEYILDAYIEDGENVIGIMLGNGFLNNIGGNIWDMDKATFRDAPKFALAVTQSGKVLFEADEKFLFSPSPVLFDDYRSGEIFDARETKDGWNEVGYDDSEWKPSFSATAPNGKPQKYDGVRLKTHKELNPLNITPCGKGYIYDFGKTWEETGKSYVAKKIRNPQVGILDGQYILHGRSGGWEDAGFVLYTSADGIRWDDGNELIKGKTACFYSNNLVVKEKDGKERMLVQYSENISISGECEKNCQPSQVNVMHLWIESV